ncbi:polyprenyl synthetase family protein [Pseudonocardia acidicola]|uniref:Polyprenyl synthetase family protein n=1 Tax=Pseudonocardia acidicola TaxID=2724939 RepID=A0ABX1SHD1_9PSEU|nr:polyprenyl synthetase family protein [Pseudonocardia acidicola]NMI00486.1 polyprenyl synthetase family protein [Pseudonocardia acidicola]
MSADVLPLADAAIPAALHDARDGLRPAMEAAVARLDDATSAIVSYHLGWTRIDGVPVERGGGKSLRPALAMLSARAAGAPADIGIPGAVAVELVHNFSLVHDDLMDGDTRRRHRPAVWTVWGAEGAILTGDALLALAQEVLLDCASPHRADAARLLAETTRHLVRGQVQDLAFERRAEVGLAECRDMVAGKTGALLSASAAIGAVLAGAPPAIVDALSRFGAQLGMAFQLVDDLLGIWGDPAATGKPVFSDLRAHKRTLPVTYAVTHGGPAGQELAGWLATPADRTGNGSGDDEAALRRAAGLVEKAGGRRWATAEARRRVGAAEDALAAAGMPDGPRAELAALARFVATREV